MSISGKHVKNAPQAASVGKHGVATRKRVDIPVLLLSALLIAAIAIIPFSFNRVLVALDSQAFAVPAQSASGVVNTTISKVAQELESLDTHPVLAQEAINKTDALRASLPEVGYTQRVAEKRQVELLDGGCELVSLSIALDAMGFSHDIHKLVDEHLMIDGNFATGYLGDPYSLGAGYPSGIVVTANSYLSEISSNMQAVDLTGSDFETLKVYAAKGYPVLVWTTMNFEEPQFTGTYENDIEWYSNEHCVVMYGFNNNNVFISDPLDGMVVRDSARFEEIYNACGQMAMVIK